MNLINGDEKNIFEKVTLHSKEKRTKLLEAFPCLIVKSHLNKKGFGLVEIVLNEKFLAELGYSIESFSTTVLQEGLPQ